ncbi:MAG: tetratricopeptide repeat protein, partial [Pseudomonadota bacterium]
MTKSNQTAKLAAALILAGGLIAAPVSLVSAAGGGGGGGGSPSASGPQYDPAEEYRQGVAAYNDGDFDAAAGHFKKVTRVAKRNGEAHYLLGLSYMKAGKTKKARKPLENAVKYSPDRIEAKRDLALAYIELERMEDAQEMLAELTSLNEKCAGSCADDALLAQSVAAVKRAMEGGAQASLGPSLKAFADLRAKDALYYQAVSAINRDEHEEGLR